MTEHDTWLTTPPETVDARTCGECANCLELFGRHVCEKRLRDDPGAFRNWRDAFDYIETRAVVDVCDAACDEFAQAGGSCLCYSKCKCQHCSKLLWHNI